MEAKKNRNIKPGYNYDHLFPDANGGFFTVKENATLEDTVKFIPKAVKKTLYQTRKFSDFIKGQDIYETCSKLWKHIYEHIQYKKDKAGYEQIRSPRRTWHDRTEGVDCDCYSVFISSVLCNLGIPHILRITKYAADYFQHIYPIVPHQGGYITMDCVTDKFNYEVPFSEKKDYPMDLQFLDGIPAYNSNRNNLYMDRAGDGMEELGKIIKRNMAKKKITPGFRVARKIKPRVAIASSAPARTMQQPAPKPPKKKKGFLKKLSLKKVLNVVNKVNPATVLLRNGVLAAMKLNVKNVAKRLRWSYLTPEQAAAKGIDASKFQRLMATRQKLEKIFYGAGGKTNNLRKAILGGKGNKDKQVPVNGIEGLGMLDYDELDYMNTGTPLTQLLGTDMYYSENMEGLNGVDLMEGLGELGEPLTLTSVGAAMGVLAGIIASLKQIGDIFKNKQKGSEDFDEATNEAAENNRPVADTTPLPASVNNAGNSAAQNSSTTNDDMPAMVNSKSAMETGDPLPSYSSSSAIVTRAGSSELPAAMKNEALVTADEEKTAIPTVTSTSSIAPAASTNDSNTGNNGADKAGFWDKNKKWIKPVGIAVGGLTLIAVGFKMFGHKSGQSVSNPHSRQLSGIPSKRKNHRRKKKSKHHHKQSVALL